MLFFQLVDPRLINFFLSDKDCILNDNSFIFYMIKKTTAPIVPEGSLTSVLESARNDLTSEF